MDKYIKQEDAIIATVNTLRGVPSVKVAEVVIALEDLTTADVAPKSEVDAMNKELRVTRQYIHDNGLEFDLLSKYDNISAKIDSFADIGKMYSEIKAEAVKEFADRLKKKLIANGIYPVLVKNTIDRLLKEMEEEKE